MTTSLTVLADTMAARFGMVADGEVLDVLKSTAFKTDKEVSNAQMMALLVVANQYGLNPWTKEIYAFPDKRGGIVPVVGVDGWSRIINEHPQFDGMDFEVTKDESTCIIFRKDRSHPTRITEFLEECSRGTDPWKSHPRRMLRHKSMIQCARLAFGFVGIYDKDEAERIVEATQPQGEVIDAATGEIVGGKSAPTVWPADAFKAQFSRWEKAVQGGLKSVDDILALAKSKGVLTPEQHKQIRGIKPAQAAEPEKPAEEIDPFVTEMNAAEEGMGK